MSKYQEYAEKPNEFLALMGYTREEFDAVRAMAQKAREENEVLKARLDALEAAGK